MNIGSDCCCGGVFLCRYGVIVRTARAVAASVKDVLSTGIFDFRDLWS